MKQETNRYTSHNKKSNKYKKTKEAVEKCSKMNEFPAASFSFIFAQYFNKQSYIVGVAAFGDPRNKE